MAAAKKTSTKISTKAAKTQGFEETLWDSANKLRGSVESAEYKHIVLSLIFLKFEMLKLRNIVFFKFRNFETRKFKKFKMSR